MEALIRQLLMNRAAIQGRRVVASLSQAADAVTLGASQATRRPMLQMNPENLRPRVDQAKTQNRLTGEISQGVAQYATEASRPFRD